MYVFVFLFCFRHCIPAKQVQSGDHLHYPQESGHPLIPTFVQRGAPTAGVGLHCFEPKFMSEAQGKTIRAPNV